MRNILCFGDSNTNGANPAGGRWERWERWTGILQKLLGDEYYVIEEGCGGRTTVMEDWLEPYKNGREQLPVALRTHRPLDLVIIMLGTNDMKHRFSLLPVDIAYGAAELGTLVERYDYGPCYPVPQVMLVSPIELGDGVENSVFTGFAPESVEISRRLASYFEAQAKVHGWHYFNAASVAGPSDKDMLHMEKEDHQALAEALAERIRDIFEKDDLHETIYG